MNFEHRSHLSPYIIAEIGVNHEGNLDLACQLCSQAKAGGAHAAKFQTYKADKLAAKNSPAYWDRREESAVSQNELFKRYDTFNVEDYSKIASHCKAIGIDFISTPFDLDCLEWLVPLMKFVKIASADINNKPLVQACSSYHKPMVISVGAATDDEIDDVLNMCNKAGAAEVNLLHCVLNYPTPPESAHLFNIERLITIYADRVASIGYSDHVAPDAVDNEQLIASVIMGATIIEKHFTHDKAHPGNDHYHAMDEKDLRRFSAQLEKIRTLWGGPHSRMMEEQIQSRKFARRSLYFTENLVRGTVLQTQHLIAKRPGIGVAPTEIDVVLGRALRHSVEEDTPLQIADLID